MALAIPPQHRCFEFHSLTLKRWMMERGQFLTLPAVSWSADSPENGESGPVLLELYDREQLPLRRYLAMLGIDAETARDVVQEAFLKLHEHLRTGGDRTNLRAWLYRVAHNAARNTQTSYRAKKTARLDDSEPAKNAPARDISAEDELLGSEREARLRQAMDQLSEAQRACLVLRAQGFKYREIAETLGLSTSTVGENVQRGLEKLKELI